jgi:hypothetical protein
LKQYAKFGYFLGSRQLIADAFKETLQPHMLGRRSIVTGQWL